jgi:multidrug efflux system outer membrane protein
MKTLDLLILSSGLAAAACAVGPNYRRPPVSTPDRTRGAAETAASPSASLADQAWWELLRDDALQSLLSEALRAGYDVRLAAWRVEEARASAGIARSEFYPQIQAGAGWSRSEQSEFIVPGADATNLWDANIALSWEIDLWGRIRRLNEAARARFLATEEARRGVMLSLLSEVAIGYFRLRALDFQLEIARRTAGAFGETHALFTGRLDAGLGSPLETASAAASLAATSATIPDLERQIADQENRLAFLVGRNPGDVARGAPLNDQLLPPEIPSGLPSALLERRPDLRQAEQELVAANAEVGAAVADFFPRISLTGAFGGVAPELSDLFGDGKRWSAGGGLLTPIIQGPRLRDQHRAALARWEQAKVRYEQSVNSAFTEVSTLLIAYQKLAAVERDQARAVDRFREAMSLSSSRYLSGLSDYLEVLQAQQQLFPAENALAQTRFERLATLVQLYKALGGGWRLAHAEDWTGLAREQPTVRSGFTGAIR